MSGEILPPRTHAIHKILFFAIAPLLRSEIEQQLRHWEYPEKRVLVTEEHLGHLRRGWGRDKLRCVTMDGQRRYSLTMEARRRLAAGLFSEQLVLDETLGTQMVDAQLPQAMSPPALPIEVEYEEPTSSIEAEFFVGGGFGDPAENKLVESAAICAVVAAYEQDGWVVQSVERDRCGYDLLCKRAAVVENVEVKGVKGAVLSFMITAGEVEQARTNPKFRLAVVTSALARTPTISKYSGADFCARFDLAPIQFRATVKA